MAQAFGAMIDMLDGSNGYGQIIDVASSFGGGAAAIPSAVAVSDSGVTAGAVQLQSGVASATGITWTNVGSAQNMVAGTGVKLTSPGAAVALIRALVTTPIVGGTVTVVITP